jgi:hypothetical protein
MFNRTAHPHFKIALLGHIAHSPCSLVGISIISSTSSTGLTTTSSISLRLLHSRKGFRQD